MNLKKRKKGGRRRKKVEDNVKAEESDGHAVDTKENEAVNGNGEEDEPEDEDVDMDPMDEQHVSRTSFNTMKADAIDSTVDRRANQS